MSWRLTVRTGPKVERATYDDVAEALEALEARGRQLMRDAPDRTIDVKLRRFAPAEQVIARLEISGPQRFLAAVRAGIDVHGDGSAAAYRGRVRREPIEPSDGENPYAVLRRAVTPAQ